MATIAKVGVAIQRFFKTGAPAPPVTPPEDNRRAFTRAFTRAFDA